MSSTEFLTCRRVLEIMVILGFMIHHMLRVNISIAIVEMVAKNASNTTLENHGPRYNWNEEEKNNVLGFFFWGYLITQVPGGRLSEKFGTKIVVGTGLLVASIATLLTPVAAHFGHQWLVFVRFCMGVAIGIHFPSAFPIASRWIPPDETSTFMSHLTASSLGVAITLPVCGYLIAYLGWPSVFYVTGSLALTWSLCWWFLVYDTPAQHPRMSLEEKEKLTRLVKGIDPLSNKRAIPWRLLLTSGPVWAIVMANTVGSATFFVAFNQLPTYMSQVLHFNIKANGWFSSLPYLVRYFMSVGSSIIADKIIRSRKLSRTVIRKSYTGTFFLGTSGLFIIQAFWGFNRIVSVTVFTCSLGLMGLLTAGAYASAVDIAPSYSGTIYGISQVPAAISGYVTTKVVALVTKERQDFHQWSYVFWMLVVSNAIAGIFCLIFVAGKQQRWNVEKDESDIEESKTSRNNIK